MGGVLYKSGGSVGVEASGVFSGILQEDMVSTVQRVKRPFIDVFIDKLFFKDTDYPLTYVPMFNMVLPLKAGQRVWVQFNQENHRYPVLWKLADEVDKPFVDSEFRLPGDGFPEVSGTTEVLKVSDKMWFISTDSYGVVHWGDQCILLSDNKILIGNGVGMLGDIVNEMMKILINLKTTGNPTQHFVSPDQILKLSKLQQIWEKVFVCQ